MKRGKNYVDSVKLYDKQTLFEPAQALDYCLQTAKAKFDETIELSVKLCFGVEVYTEKTMTYIDSVTEGEDKPLNDSAISVYIASEGDTIWDVAKAFSASPDKILEQNEIDKKLVEGQRIVFFRSLV